MLIYDDSLIFDCNPLVGSGTGPSAPIHIAGDARHAHAVRHALLLPLLHARRSALRGALLLTFVPALPLRSCADEAEPMCVPCVCVGRSDALRDTGR